MEGRRGVEGFGWWVRGERERKRGIHPKGMKQVDRKSSSLLID